MTRADSKAAVDCALAGIRAVDPYTIVVDAVRSVQPPAAEQTTTPHPALGREFTDRFSAAHSHSGQISVVSAGKAAAAMARGAWTVLGDQIARGIIIAPTPVEPPSTHWRTYQGGHPIPTEAGIDGARAMLDLAMALGADDTLLCLMSGGASALTTFPANGIALTDIQTLTTHLLRAGATIAELNCVRKHIDRLKGGRLARLAAPARVIALILSDVVGDPLDVIASGPTVPDPTTIADALSILHDRDVWDQTPPAIRHYLTSNTDESPKPGDPCFVSTTSTIIGNNTKAAEAARTHAESLGYSATLVTTTLTGESRDVGAAMAHHALTLQANAAPSSRRALIYAGETTVTVAGSGRGGRNQELTLAAAIALDGSSGITMTSIGTDGIDGPTDAAGAVADGHTLSRARALGLDAHHALADNDSYPFWRALGDLVITGPTGTNVMDLIVVTLN